MISVQRQISNCFSYIVARTNYIRCNTDVRFVLDQHFELDVYSGSSLKQLSACIHVAPLGHISRFQINKFLPFLLNDAFIASSPENSKFIVFGLTQLGLEHMIYHTRGEHSNYSNTDGVANLLSHQEKIYVEISSLGKVALNTTTPSRLTLNIRNRK